MGHGLRYLQISLYYLCFCRFDYLHITNSSFLLPLYVGCAPFYNTDVEENTNTRMVRNFDGNDYQIYAKKFIPKVRRHICMSAYLYPHMSFNII